jgi:hypothetical protein
MDTVLNDIWYNSLNFPETSVNSMVTRSHIPEHSKLQVVYFLRTTSGIVDNNYQVLRPTSVVRSQCTCMLHIYKSDRRTPHNAISALLTRFAHPCLSFQDSSWSIRVNCVPYLTESLRPRNEHVALCQQVPPPPPHTQYCLSLEWEEPALYCTESLILDGGCRGSSCPRSVSSRAWPSRFSHTNWNALSLRSAFM